MASPALPGAFPHLPGAQAGGDPLAVLITSAYYWPETAGSAPYVTGVAEFLASRGHRVVVATGFPHYPEWSQHSRGLVRREERNGVEIRRRWHYVPRSQSAVTRAAYEASLYAAGTTAIGYSSPDVILGFVPALSGAALAHTAAAFHRRPYALIFQDLLGLGAAESGIAGGRRIARFVERLEKRLARRAEAVGIIAEGFRPYLVSGGVAPQRVHRLRNWTQEVAPTESVEAVRRRFAWGADEFICLHAGNMGAKQGLDNVLAAAALLRGSKIRIVLAGAGNERDRLEARARRDELDNVSFAPPQEPGRYEAMLRAADVLLVNQRPSVGEMSLPSKLTSYFAAGRPIVAAVAPESEAARELRAAGAGVVVGAGQPGELAVALRTIAASGDGNFGAQGRSYAARQLVGSELLAAYERLLRRAVAARNGAPEGADGE